MLFLQLENTVNNNQALIGSTHATTIDVVDNTITHLLAADVANSLTISLALENVEGRLWLD